MDHEAGCRAAVAVWLSSIADWKTGTLSTMDDSQMLDFKGTDVLSCAIVHIVLNRAGLDKLLPAKKA